MLRHSAALLIIYVLAGSACWSARAADPDQRLEHLVRAAAHLELAGLTEQAAEVRTQIQTADPATRQRVLEQKLSALAGLQAEIAALQRTEAASPQVLIRLQLLRLDRAKIQHLGLAFAQLLDQPQLSPVIDDSGKLAAFLDVLRQQGLVQVLAEPALMATVGREAVFTSGGTRESNADQQVQPTKNTAADSPEFYGTHVRCRPQIDGSTIRLDLSLRCAQLVLDHDRAPAGAGGGATGGAARSVIDLSTTLQLPPGQTAILGGLRVAEGQDQSDLIALVRVDPVQNVDPGTEDAGP